MIEHQKVSQRQAIYFVYLTGFGTIIFLHSAVIALAGRGTWVVEIFGILSLIPLAIWILRLGDLAPGHTIFEIMEMTAGKVIGRAVGGVYVLNSIMVSALTLRSLSGMLQILTLPETPVWVTIMMVVVLAAIIADSGIEVQGRLAEVLIVVGLIIWFVGLTPGVFTLKTTYLIPVFDRTVGELAAGAYLAAGSVAEVNLFLLVMVAAIPRPGDNKWALTRGFVGVGLILGFAALLIIGVFSAEEGARITYGGFNVAQNLQVGKFIQGLEVLIQVAYILAIIMKVTAHSYAGWVVASRICNHWRPRIWLVGIIILTAVLAIQVISYNEAFYFSILLSRYVTLPFIILILLLTTVSVLIRGGKAVNQGK